MAKSACAQMGRHGFEAGMYFACLQTNPFRTLLLNRTLAFQSDQYGGIHDAVCKGFPATDTVVVRQKLADGRYRIQIVHDNA